MDSTKRTREELDERDANTLSQNRPKVPGWNSPAHEEEARYHESIEKLLGPKTGNKKPAPAGSSKGTGGLLSGSSDGEAEEEGGMDRTVLIFFVALGAVLLVLLVVSYLVFFRGDPGASSAAQAGQGANAQDRGAEGGGAAAGGNPGDSPIPEVAEVEPEATGIVFEKPVIEGENYSQKVGDYTWSGRVFKTENTKQWILEGTTAAHFTRAVDLPDADGDGKDDWIITGVFGRAKPDQPVLHATFQRTRAAGAQHTTGTYQVIDGGDVILEGDYTDQVTKDNSGDKPDDVVRYYKQSVPGAPASEEEVLAYSYKAHPDALIAGLVGWNLADAQGEAGGSENQGSENQGSADQDGGEE